MGTTPLIINRYQHVGVQLSRSMYTRHLGQAWRSIHILFSDDGQNNIRASTCPIKARCDKSRLFGHSSALKHSGLVHSHDHPCSKAATLEPAVPCWKNTNFLFLFERPFSFRGQTNMGMKYPFHEEEAVPMTWGASDLSATY